MVATLLDLANFTAASITLRGLDEPDISMLRSAFVQRIAQVGGVLGGWVGGCKGASSGPTSQPLASQASCQESTLFLFRPWDRGANAPHRLPPPPPAVCAAQKVQGQVFGIAFSLVRNFGIVGGASKLLGALSAGGAKLAAAEVT